MRPTQHRTASGFTLVEALVALVIIAFGMLSIAGMQINLSRNGDVAKQRSEAVRLGQALMEQLRSFEAVGSDVGKFDYTDDVVSGCDDMAGAGGGCTALAYTSNTSFRREWTVTSDGINPANGTHAQKWISVAVLWTDRSNVQQRVELRSVISRADPINLGTVFTGPGGTKARTPKNRSINIPYPAYSHPGDRSSFRPPGANNINFVFDNTNGDVLGFCTDAAVSTALTNNTTLEFAGFSGATTTTSGCTVQSGYLLSGYISFITNQPNGNEEQVDSGLTTSKVDTKNLAANVAFGTSMPVSHPPAQCFAEQQKVLDRGGINIIDIANSPAPQRSGNIVTIQTTTNHGFNAGAPVAVNNVVDKSFNGLFTILDTPNANTFRYSQTGPNATSAAPATGAVVPTATLVQQVILPDSATAPPGFNGAAALVAKFVAYTCVVQGYDDDADEGSAAKPTARKWWGQFTITPLPPAQSASGTLPDWTLSNSGSSNWHMCRFTGDYIIDDTLSNTEHPLHYRGVKGPLDNQNYIVIPANQNCPTDSKTAPLTGDFINTHTERHQNVSPATGTAPFGGVLSQASGQWSSAGRENSTPSIVIPMVCPLANGPDCF